MALDTASKTLLQSFGIDPEALSAAVTATAETPFTFTPKGGEVKIGDNTFHIYDTAGHEGLKGRVKQEVLTQAEEIGIKAIKKAANIEFEGKDPLKLIEAIEAKLKLPVDDKLKEKDRDILQLKTNWETEKAAREKAELLYKDREELDRDISFFPDNRIKSVKDKTLRMELKDEGITFGEHEGKPAVFVNGEVKKNADLSLVDPKTFTGEFFKTKGWIVEETPQGKQKSTFDTKTPNNNTSKPAFNHDTTYASVVAKYGSFNDKAQAEYTIAQLESAG